jgi:hypothetical protein
MYLYLYPASLTHGQKQEQNRTAFQFLAAHFMVSCLSFAKLGERGWGEWDIIKVDLSQ